MVKSIVFTKSQRDRCLEKIVFHQGYVYQAIEELSSL
jgi:hypothetical protein